MHACKHELMVCVLLKHHSPSDTKEYFTQPKRMAARKTAGLMIE